VQVPSICEAELEDTKEFTKLEDTKLSTNKQHTLSL
jgi:hypothetical protein